MNGPLVPLMVACTCLALLCGWVAHEIVDYLSACYWWALHT